MHTIMLAEDHDDTRELLHDVLTLEAEWNVAAMPSGSALLNTAASVVPDLVMLDISMPGIDGLETYRELREREEMRDVPVLFVTANPHRLAGMALRGPFEMLVKPFTVDALIAQVSALLNRTSPSVSVGITA
jgi:DNA-binding response OmpR family regulator